MHIHTVNCTSLRFGYQQARNASNLGTYPIESSQPSPPRPSQHPKNQSPKRYTRPFSYMSYLLHGSTGYTGMGWVDLVPRAGNLYIGGLYALYQTDLIRAAGITHVLSVIDYDALLQEKFSHLAHFHIRADDHPNENLLQYFDEGVRYIDGALNGTRSCSSSSDGKSGNVDGDDSSKRRGGVFVHCAMGKSRSATLVVAYLIWKFHLDPDSALDQLCEGRPVCDPNPGFKEQLRVWEKMCKAESEAEQKAIYAEWERTRFTGESWEWEDRMREMKAKL